MKIKISKTKTMEIEEWKAKHKELSISRVGDRDNYKKYCNSVLNRLKRYNYRYNIIEIVRMFDDLTILYPAHVKLDESIGEEKVWSY